MMKVYLAGPDVFEPDAIAQGEHSKALCRAYGLEGLYPLDNTIDTSLTPQRQAQAIREANLALIKSADLVIADLNPFRGFEPDSGTVYEVGFAEALGKPVYAYAKDRRVMVERLRDVQGLDADASVCEDAKQIEDFGHSHNLMFTHTIIATDLESCLQMIATMTQGDQEPL